MALTDESNGNGFFMPVAPAYNGGYGNGGFGAGGDWWGILLLIALLNGEPRQTSRAIFVPAAVDTYGNVTSTAIITVPKGCCFSPSVRYVAADEDPATVPTPVIEMQNANLVISRIA